MKKVAINWSRCNTYDEAIDHQGGVYLHEWDDKPFYWGIVDRSVFGGNRRKIKGKTVNPRYGRSYKHWIEGCLLHGAKLYIGAIKGDSVPLKAIEAHLIDTYGTDQNMPPNAARLKMTIEHTGDVPASISGR